MRWTEVARRRRTGRAVLVAAGVLSAGLVALVAGCGGGADARQAEVAERGAEVMPFDLDATTHTFTTTPDGGLQVVTADDPEDAAEVALIRAHLDEERTNFARGDFDDPALIHGHDMPGVSALAAGYQAIEIAYAEVPGGASLRYTTARADLVEAIHAWFDRQVMDHGEHAEAG